MADLLHDPIIIRHVKETRVGRYAPKQYTQFKLTVCDSVNLTSL